MINTDLSKINVERKNTKLEKHERLYDNLIGGRVKIILYQMIKQ